ncbi:MAG: ribosome maturation factor RimM [Oscillospiraceae bacterium]|jgi:16S rRNA processing protein RimM|nr:ribosome maturation factor RimM [Oscillospiraceae bacterium]
MLKQFLEVGQIVSTHGVRGEVRVNPWCDSPAFLQNFKTLYFSDDGKEAVKVTACRPHGNIAILKLKGVDTVEQAASLRNRLLYMDRSDVSMPEGSYYIQDLIGCAVRDADTGAEYGVLHDVSETGANDVWHIRAPGGREYLIPAIADVVAETDVEARLVKIRPLKGIFDDED